MSGLSLRLFGTETSPYVRRVRIVAHEVGVPVDLVNTADDAGQAKLRAVTPIWKVPTATFVGDGEETTVFDSLAISTHLMRLAGAGPLADFDDADADAKNLMLVIDGALDALINAFYLAKDGVTGSQSAYVAKQRERAASACHWLEDRVSGNALVSADRPHLADIALGTTVGWMKFRSAYPIDDHPALVRCYEALAERESFAVTRPPEG